MTARDIDVALLRAFVAVAESGGMTSAARALHRTQGAVSQQIARLERLFGVKLFDRRPGTVLLTGEGERLLTSAYRLIAENDDLMARMRGIERAGEVRLGVPPDVVGALVPPVLRRFGERYPEVAVTLVSAGTNALRRMLSEGSVDIMVATDTNPAADGPLWADELVWVGTADGRACTRRPLPVALGEEGCAFRASAIDALTRAGLEWRAMCHVGSLEPVLATLEADTAVGVFLSRTVPARLTRVAGRTGLTKLPACYVNLILPTLGGRPAANELARCLRSESQG